MSQAEQEIYEEFADKCDRQGDARQRDLFLVLAADAAYGAGNKEQADRLRLRLLELSPHHLLRPFANFAEALRSSDIQDYLTNLRRQFPPAQLLAGVGKPFPSAAPREGRQPATFGFQQAQAGPTPPSSRFVPHMKNLTALPLRRRNEPIETPGGWLTLLLFLVVLAGALALAAWTVIWPLWH